MKKLSLALAALALLAAPSRALADAIPYSPIGTPNTDVYSFVAAFDGDIYGYFLGGDAGYGSVVSMSVNDGAYGGGVFQNHNTAVGAQVLFASALAGDILRLKLDVSTDPNGPPPFDFTFFSDPDDNPLGLQHIYATAYTGAIGGCNVLGTTCTYVGWEDLVALGDRDYNDHQFLFKGVTTVPDGGPALALLGVALTGLGMLRRRLS